MTAVVFCMLLNRAFEAVSLPETKTPIQPDQRRHEREEVARDGEGAAQRDAHAGVIGKVGEADDGADRNERVAQAAAWFPRRLPNLPCRHSQQKRRQHRRQENRRAGGGKPAEGVDHGQRLAADVDGAIQAADREFDALPGRAGP